MIQPIEIRITYTYNEDTWELRATASAHRTRGRPTILGRFLFQEVAAQEIVASIGAITAGITDLTDPRVRQWFRLQVRQRIQEAF